MKPKGLCTPESQKSKKKNNKLIRSNIILGTFISLKSFTFRDFLNKNEAKRVT